MELLREAVIGQHFAVPLEYGDITGLKGACVTVEIYGENQ